MHASVINHLDKATLASFEEAYSEMSRSHACTAFQSVTAATTALWSALCMRERQPVFLVTEEVVFSMRTVVSAVQDIVADCEFVVFGVEDTVEHMRALVGGRAVRAAMFETLPHGRAIDVKEMARRLRMVDPNMLVATENSAMTCASCCPMRDGADLCIEALRHIAGTKAEETGAVVFAASPDMRRKLRAMRTCTGATPQDVTTWCRNLGTLPLRSRQVAETAERFAAWAADQRGVTDVLHPRGTPVVMVRLPALQDRKAAFRFMDGMRVVKHGTWWSYMEAFTCVNIWEMRGAPDAPGGWLRFAVGLTPFEDLRKDVEQALP